MKAERGIAKEKLATARGQFANFAKYYADIVSHPLIHRAAQDPSLKTDGNGIPIPTIDAIIKGLDRFILEPNPFVRTSSDDPTPKVNFHNADYIREFGVAMDAALKPLVESHPERVVRINATRIYAAVCRSGANAHWPTVTGWIANANTPTETKYYALQAAANLLDAYDVFDYKSRRHSFDQNPRTTADKTVGELIAALQECILNPGALVALPGGKSDKIPEDQEAVIVFVRRQAVKALGSVRFVVHPGPKGDLYPAHTLVRVCMSDPAITPAPSPSECAEAIIGLCNMAPNRYSTPVKGFNGDAVAEAIASGLITFAAKRAPDPFDRSLPWRGYSIRINDAFKSWPPLFDPLYDPLAPKKAELKLMPKEITDSIARAQTLILIPMEKVDTSGKPDLSVRVDIEAMKAYLAQLQNNPKRSGMLITGIPATALPKAK
ncbi:MAG: hypothetical protein U0792_20050 [Gemmataceae bacterium]